MCRRYSNSWLFQSSTALESQKLVRRVMVAHRKGAWEGFRRARRTEVLRSYPITLGGVNWLLAGRGACAHAVCVLAVWRVAVDLPLEGVIVPRESEGARAAGRGCWDGAPKGALLQGAAGWKGFFAKRRRESRGERRVHWWDGSWPWLPKRQWSYAVSWSTVLWASTWVFLGSISWARNVSRCLPGTFNNFHLGNLLSFSLRTVRFCIGRVPVWLALASF